MRSLYIVTVAVIATLFYGSLVLLIAAVRSTSPLIEPLIRRWARTLVRAAGIDVQGENLEILDPNKRYILVANHYSYFDIPCIFAAVNQPIRFMAKASLFQIPIFGWAIGRAGFIPIDRKNRRSAVKSFDLAADRIRKGNTIVIFPEEGRSRTREMRPFQRGAFLLAIKSQQTMVPIAVDGTFDAFPVGARRVTPGRVTVRAGTPIETAGCTLRDKDRLAEASRTEIARMLRLP
ncbi:MAG TPA: lysophospholipid acyltransferase family protein [Thermoanaerobaculia bacterium]